MNHKKLKTFRLSNIEIKMSPIISRIKIHTSTLSTINYYTKTRKHQ